MVAATAALAAVVVTLTEAIAMAVATVVVTMGKIQLIFAPAFALGPFIIGIALRGIPPARDVCLSRHGKRI